jgi:hypothetical protein
VFVYYGWPDFERKAEAIADLLRRRGFDAVVRTGRSLFKYLQLSSSPNLWIGFWNEYHAGYMPDSYIFYNGEQLSMPHWKDDESWTRGLRNALEVWDYAPSNEQIVAGLGVRFQYVPFGYAPYYESSFQANTRGKGLVQDIDVLCVGQLTDRRRLVIDRLQGLGVKVHSVTRANPAHGVTLDLLIARAKIVLSVYSYDDPSSQLADYARLDHLLANRRFIVQERPSRIGSDAALEQAITTCSYNELPDTCGRMLADPDARTRVSDAAYEWFKSERSLDRYIPWARLREYVDRMA